MPSGSTRVIATWSSTRSSQLRLQGRLALVDHAGATVYPWPVFDVDAVLDVIERERISVLPGPPTLLQEVLDAPSRDDHDLSSLRLTITGSASVPVSLIRRLHAEMSFETVLTGYGLTETSAVVSVSRHDDDPERTAAWAGKPVADTEVKVVDDDGREVPTGEQGGCSCGATT